MRVPLELRIGSDLPGDDSTDAPSFGIPSHMIPDFEILLHRGYLYCGTC
jgi:hypothetical protein